LVLRFSGPSTQTTGLALRTSREYLAERLAPLFRRREIGSPDAARIAEWIEKAGGLGVDLLLGDS